MQLVWKKNLTSRSCFSTVPLLIFLITLKLVTAPLARYMITPEPKSYSFLGGDYPQKWTVDQRKPVLMALHDSVRYHPNTNDGAAEWAALVPGHGLIYLGEHRRPFSIAMFHQLRCLDIMRSELVRLHQPNRTIDSDSETALLDHCTNYIRQMLLCDSDIHLQTFTGTAANTDPNLNRCNDWGAVYEEVQKNQLRHSTLRK